MKKPLIIILLISLSVSACRNTNTDKNIEPVNISLNKNALQKISCSDVLDYSRYVILETREESLIGKIDDIIISDSHIFIVDKNICKSVFIFDQEGQYISNISKYGKGPSEYLKLSDIEYDRNNNQILILDFSNKKILKYDLCGESVGEIMLDDNYVDLKILDNNKYLLYSNFYSHKYKFFTIIDNNGKIINHFLNTSKKHFGIGSNENGHIVKNNELTLITTPYNKNIYTVSNDNYSEYLTFSFSDYFYDEEPQEVDYTKLESIEEKIINRETISEINNLRTVRNILYFNFIFMNDNYSVFFDTQNKRLIKSGVLVSDSSNLFLGNKIPIGQTEDELVFELRPSSEIKRYNRLKENPEFTHYLEKYRELFENEIHTNEDNPTLLFYRLNQ